MADPVGALKTTGKHGRHTYGVFAARDARTNVLVPGSQRSETERFDIRTTGSVGRYRMDFGRNSAVGASLTSREGDTGGTRKRAGVILRNCGIRKMRDQQSVDGIWWDAVCASSIPLCDPRGPPDPESDARGWADSERGGDVQSTGHVPEPEGSAARRLPAGHETRSVAREERTRNGVLAAEHHKLADPEVDLRADGAPDALELDSGPDDPPDRPEKR